jgi:hypothetical protein
MITVAQLVAQLQNMPQNLPVQVLQTKTGTVNSINRAQCFTFATSIEICEDDGDIETVLLYI